MNGICAIRECEWSVCMPMMTTTTTCAQPTRHCIWRPQHGKFALHVQRVRSHPTVDRSFNASKTDDFVAVIRFYNTQRTIYDSKHVSLTIFISFGRFSLFIEMVNVIFLFYSSEKPLFDPNKLVDMIIYKYKYTHNETRIKPQTKKKECSVRPHFWRA